MKEIAPEVLGAILRRHVAHPELIDAKAELGVADRVNLIVRQAHAQRWWEQAARRDRSAKVLREALAMADKAAAGAHTPPTIATPAAAAAVALRAWLEAVEPPPIPARGELSPTETMINGLARLFIGLDATREKSGSQTRAAAFAVEIMRELDLRPPAARTIENTISRLVGRSRKSGRRAAVKD